MNTSVMAAGRPKEGFTLLFMKKRLMHFLCASRLFLVYKSMNDNEI